MAEAHVEPEVLSRIPLADEAHFVREAAARARACVLNLPRVVKERAELDRRSRPETSLRANDFRVGPEDDPINLVSQVPLAPVGEAGRDRGKVFRIENVARFSERVEAPRLSF